MKKFKISELDCFSGIKAHTIRIWEQRYNIFKPERTIGNIRYYSLHEVKLLLDIALLQQCGHRISTLSRMEPAELAGMVEELSAEESIPGKAINDLIILMFNFEIEEFEDVLDSCVHVMGITATVSRVIVPFMERVQLIATAGSTETHFAVAALRKKLMVAIESASPENLLQKTVLLFLPEREHFDLILLYAAWAMKVSGLRLLYLGAGVSRQALEEITVAKKPDLILTCLSPKAKLFVNPIAPFLLQTLPDTQLFVLGREKEGLPQPYRNVQYLHYSKVEELTEEPLALVAAL
ncbi:MAG: MerR family transcriptional regulator [Chitinophagaceae bacterium]